MVHPAALSLPHWPEHPGRVDSAGTSFLILSFGGMESAATAGVWISQAQDHGPTTALAFDTLDDDAVAALAASFARCRTGVRIMVVGGQHDVLAALALARSYGACDAELTSFATHTDDLGFYCAHCRGTHRAHAAPGQLVVCPGCGRTLEVHAALNASRGSFLASDARRSGSYLGHMVDADDGPAGGGRR